MVTIDQVVSALVYLLCAFAVFLVGKWIYDKLHPRFVLREELLVRDNLALALAMVGYYLGLVIAIGGVLEGTSYGLIEGLLDIFFYGLIAVILLNISALLNDKVILRHFDNQKEIIDDQNVGTGVIEAGNHVAVGLIVYGAISGEGGDLLTAAAFWLIGQAVLILTGVLYNVMTPFDIHDEIEKDNVAVGVAFSGALIALGNIIRISIEGDFVSWSQNLAECGGFTLFGLLLLPVVRWVTDKILLPGHRLSDELVNQEKPNVGAGAIEAMSYVAASFLLGWVA